MNPSNQNPYGLERPPFPPNPVPNYEVPPIAPPVTYGAPAPAVDARTRNAGIALFVCAGLMLLGLGSHSWFTAPDGEGGIGLLGLERCRSAGCQTMTWFDAKRVPGEILVFSGAGILGILVAVGFLIHTGVMLLKNRAKKVVMVGLNASLGLAAFGIVSFLMYFGFGEMSRELSWGWAGFAALAGVITAGVIIPAVVRPLAKRPA